MGCGAASQKSQKCHEDAVAKAPSDPDATKAVPSNGSCSSSASAKSSDSPQAAAAPPASPAAAPAKDFERLPVLANNESRLVIETVMPMRQYRLNPVYAAKIPEGATGAALVPDGVSDKLAWKMSRWSLWEKPEGLELELKSKAASEHNMIVHWSGDPSNKLAVEVLPPVSVNGLLGEKKDSKAKFASNDSNENVDGHDEKVEIIDIPQEHIESPTQLFPFVVRWVAAGGKKKSACIGCEDEETCHKWVAHLKLYSHLDKRYCGAIFWKLNRTALEGLPEKWWTTPEGLQKVAGLRSWRRRVFYLEHLHHHKALCMTYVSEKLDVEESIVHMLTKVNAESHVEATASVKELAVLPLQEPSPSEKAQVIMSVEQYDLAVARASDDPAALVLPTKLHMFEVAQKSSQSSEEGVSEVGVYAFEDDVMLKRWLGHLHLAGQSVARHWSSPVPVFGIE